jgi:hypothetical protein
MESAVKPAMNQCAEGITNGYYKRAQIFYFSFLGQLTQGDRVLSGKNSSGNPRQLSAKQAGRQTRRYR